MSINNVTQGEWLFGGSGVYAKDGITEESVCLVWAVDGNNARCDANGHLIAAAPHLYQACMNAANMLDDVVPSMMPFGWSNVRDELRKAIAKAEGVQL